MTFMAVGMSTSGTMKRRRPMLHETVSELEILPSRGIGLR